MRQCFLLTLLVLLLCTCETTLHGLSPLSTNAASPARRRRTPGALAATSSSALKKEGSASNKKKLPRDSVVRRLKRAATRAVETSQKEKNLEQQQSSRPLQQQQEQEQARPLPAPPLFPTLRQLTQVIDQKLQSTPRTPSLQQSPPDSIGAIYTHNNLNPRPSVDDATTKHVAIVLAKPLQDDQLTVEGAARVRLLASSMLHEKHPYHPHLVVFVGAITGDNRVADADAAYIYFRYLWNTALQRLRQPLEPSVESQSPQSSDPPVQVRTPQFHIERSQLDQGGLQQLTQLIQQTYLPIWWEELQLADKLAKAESSSQASLNSTTVVSPRRKRLQIHFSIVSSEYQLCQLNDIHNRSPNQSALRALRSLARTSSSSSSPQVDAPTWSFHGVTSVLYSHGSHSNPTGPLGAAPQLHQHHHPLRAFCAKTYKTAQDMVPVLYNLRGVADNREFFQRDNYRALVAARRSLIHDMERMYHLQPSLQSFHRSSGAASTTFPPSVFPPSTSSPNIDSLQTPTNNNKPLDVVLESALLSLGRCLDLVRPAGMLTGSVSLDDFKRALSSLQQAYYLLDRACDPDEPLSPDEWARPLEVPSSTAARFSSDSPQRPWV